MQDSASVGVLKKLVDLVMDRFQIPQLAFRRQSMVPDTNGPNLASFHLILRTVHPKVVEGLGTIYLNIIASTSCYILGG